MSKAYDGRVAILRNRYRNRSARETRLADLPLLRMLKMRGHLLLHRKALAKRLNASGPLQPPAITALAHVLAAALPPGLISVGSLPALRAGVPTVRPQAQLRFATV